MQWDELSLPGDQIWEMRADLLGPNSCAHNLWHSDVLPSASASKEQGKEPRITRR